MRKINSRLFFVLLTLGCSVFISADMVSSSAAPTGNTGAEGGTCDGCHFGNSLNASDGRVIIEGLPSTYTPGTAYDFSVKINHGALNRTSWGFAIKAVTTTTTNRTIVGTFSETNPNARVLSGEIGHQFAPGTPASDTYTFNNLKWTAPSNPNTAESNITFYVVGNAANGQGNMAGDFIYTATQTMTLSTTAISERSFSAENLKIITSGKSITLDMNLPNAASIQPMIYTLGGQKILSLPAKKYNSGSHQISIDGSNLSNGTYIMIIQNAGKSISKKFVL